MSKTTCRALTLSALLTLTGMAADAIPARRGIVDVPQPDGTTVQARIYGDEYHHFATTPDGLPLIQDADGFLRASDTDPELFMAAMSDMAARAPRRQRMAAHTKAPARVEAQKGYGLVPGTSFPSTGSPRALVLLVEYSDVKFNLDNPHDYFDRMINERGFSDYGGTGSAMDFFVENSGGQFTPQFDVFGPVTLGQPRSYYGANNSAGDDARAYMMAIDGCRAIDSQTDFSVYDNDGDGVIDNVFIFFAGEAESSTYVADQVWPHTFFVSYATSVPVVLDGVRLDRYACSNEWNEPRAGRPGRPDGVGTFVHEFSHVMGLPDLYSTQYNSAFTPGQWSTLDYGPYNNDGCTPPNYSVFERYALGWLTPREITSAANVRLEDITHNQAAMIPTIKDTEFFLFENRQQQGWDEYIPGHGMLVWHIDYDATKWQINTVNNTVAHQNVDIEEADGMGTEETRADDAFPGGLNRTSFTDTTIPSMLPWTGRSIGLPVTDIAESADGIITFKVAGGRPDIAVPEVLEPADVTPGGFTARWQAASEPDCSYTLSVYTRTAPGSRGIVYVQGYNHLNVGTATSYTVTGLDSDTQYYYTVCTLVKEGESEPSAEMAVRTDPPTFDYLAPVADEAGDIAPDAFTARWLPMDGAVEYFLTVTTPVADGQLKAVCDFTGGIAGMPEGWSTTATSTYAIAGNCGEATPSLRLTKEGQYLLSATMPEHITHLVFWCRGVSTAADDRITVEGIRGNGSAEVITRLTPVTTAGGVIMIVELPTDIYAVRLVAAHTKGSIAIDDVTLLYGTAYTHKPLPQYDRLSTGASTEMRVTGLTPATPYAYYVHASDGTLTSLPSATVSLTTPEEAGMTAAVASECTVAVCDLTVSIGGCKAGRVDAFDIAGRLAASATVKDGHATFTLPAHGIYIIAADGTNIAKIATK